ncbi:MAG: HDOD domain-containing protein [Methyloprofundus sp.]|nr:HDOD domain-containing protein [Methyloprofundus sp.]
MTDQKNRQLDIAKLKNLPVMPEENQRILMAINDEDIDLDDLSEILKSSPILMARLIGLANSAYFGYAGQVTDLRVAVVNVLGLKLVKSLSLSILIGLSFSGSRCKSFDSQRFWLDALLTAVCAQALVKAAKLKDIDANTAYTAGMVLHIGMLAVVFLYPDEVADIFALAQKEELDIDQLILEKGMDQYLLGGYLLERWKLPSLYSDVVEEYRVSEVDYANASLHSLLKVASLLRRVVRDNQEQLSEDEQKVLKLLAMKEKQFFTIKAKLAEKMDDLNALVQTMAGGK